MNLRDLRYVIALADLKHFGRAADAVHVSQPTLSTQVRKLEDELGVTLFERSPRNVLLTDAGERVLARVRKIVREIDEIRTLARSYREPGAGTLRLGVFPTLAPYLLPHVVPSLRARFPKLELLLIEEKTTRLIEQLELGQIDAAILAQPVHDERLAHQFLFEEPFVLAVPDDHRLAQHQSLTLDALDDVSLLLLEDGHCLRDQALAVCELAGAREKDGFRATSLETLRQMVAAHVGATLLPVLAVKPPVAHSASVRLIPFDKGGPTRRIAMFWRRSSAMAPFLREIAAVVGDLPPALLRPDDLAPKRQKKRRRRAA